MLTLMYYEVPRYVWYRINAALKDYPVPPSGALESPSLKNGRDNFSHGSYFSTDQGGGKRRQINVFAR